MVTRLKILNVAGERTFLSGLFGRAIYPKLIEMIDKQKSPSPVFLDFSGLSASGSFFGQSIMPLRSFARRMNAYIVLCNLNEDSQDELRWLLEDTSDAVYICDIDDSDIVSNATCVGNLDPKQKLTFEAVVKVGESDANEIAERFPSERIEVTGWNNRLAALNKKGLLMEFKDGRSKRYRPVLQNVAIEV